jgi:uncharacterized protein (DUF1330 family)
MTASAPAYAIGYLRDVDLCADVIRYMREIDATLAPFGGEFVIHGGYADVREGDWGDGDLVMIRFPDLDSAARWYDSAEYQRILPLRTDHSKSIVVLVQGVGHGHTAAARVDELIESVR